MAIICGEDGKSSNDCTFARSPDHMFVQHANGSDMVVMGIKFIDAWSMSIRTSLNQNRENTLTFIDCHWKNNSGVYFNLSRSTIYVYMHVILKHCTFEDNRPSQDLIKVQSSGKATLIDCVFKSNRASRTIVLVNDGGSVSLTRVCFLNNIGITAYGTVASMHTDGLETSENTYFADNDMRIGCSNGFSVVTPTTSTCDEPSITNACIAEDIGGEFFIPLPTSAPSKVPSTSPSSLPTVTPSVTPTMIPSVSPSLTPSSKPSFAPTSKPSDTPTVTPTMIPSVSPSLTPSSKPSFAPTNKPSDTPTVIPSISHSPSAEKSDEPTQIPSISHAPSSDTKINSNSLETSDALKKYSSAAGFWYSAFFITLLLCA